MSISSAMYAGITGLDANGEALNVVGDNIANLNTTGFKYSRAYFEDLLAQNITTGSGISQVGRGTQLASVTPIFSQGSLEGSDSDTAMAISGTGFFQVQDPNSQAIYYTRDGNFYIDNNGNLVNSSGYQVLGKQMVNGSPTGVDEPIQIDQNYAAPKATSLVDMVVNLNSGAATGDTYSSSVAVYDSQGTSHTLTLTFTKSATANTWSPSYEVDSSGTIVPLTPDLTFNSSGQLIGGGSYTLDLSTYNIGTVSLNMANTSGGSTTQYASASTTNYAAQNGYPPGFLQGVSVDTDGIIYGKYSNGQNLSLYQLTLARFNTPGKLDREGNNLYSETQDSGTALTGAPGTNGLGLVNGNSLEQSNVDLANEFVHMILYQRGFQANSRVITTTDSMLEEVLAMKR